MRMTDLYDYSHFWEILGKFPKIKSLSDLTDALLEIEGNSDHLVYPVGYEMLKEFESAMRSHMYTEWHAQEYFDDAEAANTP